MQNLFQPNPVKLSGMVVKPVDPDPNQQYSLIVVDGYRYLLPFVFDAAQASFVSSCQVVPSIAVIRQIDGKELEKMSYDIPVSTTKELFPIDAYFYHETSIVRTSSTLDKLILTTLTRTNLEPSQEQRSTSHTITKSPDGNIVVSVDINQTMYLTWDGENLVATSSREEDAIKIAGTVRNAVFNCKYGSFDIRKESTVG